LIAFARKFTHGHVKRFRKDISICLTGRRKIGQKGNYTHAYFPALMACVGILDLFSGLHAGDIEHHGLSELQKYARRFLPSYNEEAIAVLYNCFRHKVAHLGHPYPVFDTRTKKKDFTGERKLVGWQVNATRRKPALLLKKLDQPKAIKSAPRKWNVSYDHAMHVSVRQFASDIVESISGYLAYVRNDTGAKRRFEKCMNQYFAE